jgi:hypothetical protein
VRCPPIPIIGAELPVLEIDHKLGSSRTADRSCLRPAGNPGGVVGRHLVGVIACEVDPARLLCKGEPRIARTETRLLPGDTGSCRRS